MKTRFLTVLSLLAVTLTAGARTVKSPDGKLEINVSVKGGVPVYRISYEGRAVVKESALGFELAEGAFLSGVKEGRATERTVHESYDLPVGKTSHVESVSREMRLPLIEKNAPGRRVDLVVRAFDEAVALRFEFPAWNGTDSLLVRAENMEINPAGNPELTGLILPGFRSSHEGPYTVSPFGSYPEGELTDLPLTFDFGGLYMTYTEACVLDYPGMYLVREGGSLRSVLSPRLDRPDLAVVASLPHKTPWRVFMVSRKVGDFISSNVLTTLSEPCRIDDTSWLKPGKTTFPWWNDTCVPDTSFQAGNNFDTAKYYIDFAAENGLDYHSLYGYGDMPWYFDDGPGFWKAGPGADLTRPVGQLDFERVCRYARYKGVDIHVWLNWEALYKDIDNVFDKFNEWGVKGMMVDFMDRDDQQMIQIQEDILRKAAAHHLFIQFHGACKPSGLVRTYPNEFTREGTRNYEVYKWTCEDMGADHDIHMPFTRVVAGATDYHLGGFRAVREEDYSPRVHRPLVTSTRGHMLGMYIVLESYLQMVCDDPEAYRGQDGFKFLCGIPTTWDETVVPACSLNEYVVVARRSGEDWFVGGIGNSVRRNVSVGLDFLGEGEYLVEICQDAPDSDINPNHLSINHLRVRHGDTLHVPLESGGGFAAKFSPVR